MSQPEPFGHNALTEAEAQSRAEDEGESIQMVKRADQDLRPVRPASAPTAATSSKAAAPVM